MSTGRISSAIRMAILSITSVDTELEAVYGFGSSFRGELFNDIDLLAVAAPSNTETLVTYYKVAEALQGVAAEFGCPCHLTMLTLAEYASRPLRNMDELRCLWRARSKT